MQNNAVLKGHAGELRWGYRLAGEVGPWSITANPKGCTLSASIVSTVPFAVDQQPLAFVVPRGEAPSWRWPILNHSIVDGRITATLEP